MEGEDEKVEGKEENVVGIVEGNEGGEEEKVEDWL